MKRPLLWAALLLTLGILILNSRPEIRDKWLLRKPSVRLALEKSSSGYFPVSLRGKVLWAEEKNGRYVYRVDCGRKYGIVLVYEPDDGSERTEEATALIGSDARVSGTAFLFPPSENPGQFDLRNYYDDLGIYFGVSEAEIWTDDALKHSFRRTLFRAAESFRKVIRETESPEDADFLLSLTTGDTTEIGTQMKAEASFLSAIQLVSVSGFLLSALGMLFYRLLRKLTSNLFLCAGIPFLAIVLYDCLLGSPASMIRALVIFALRVIAPILKRRFDILSAASLYVILLAFTRPSYLLLPSMSFYLAVLLSQGLICPLVRRFTFRQNVLVSASLSFLSIQACLLPVQILSRYAWSLYGMILVYFLMPLKMAALILTLLGGAVGVVFGRGSYPLVRFILFLPGRLRSLYELVLNAFRVLPLASVNAGKPAVRRIVSYAVLLFTIPAALSIRGFLVKKAVLKEQQYAMKTGRLISLCYFFILALGMCFLRAPKPGKALSYTMLSVGQGDSGIVRAQDVTIGVDVGSSSADNAGEIFSEALSYYGIKRLDLLILSHGDLDHVNGLPSLLQDPGISLREVWIPDTLHAEEEFHDELIHLRSAGIPVRKAGTGDHYDFNDLSVQVLSPEHGADLSGNDASLVVRISYRGRSILFAGDISAEMEEKLPLDDNIDLLKVAHHGSRFSSGETFLKRISPKLSFVSYGRNNSYGHPAEEALDRFRENHLTIYGTGRSGAIEAVIQDTQISLRFYGMDPWRDLPLNDIAGH
ncbi:MAG: ComEC/Rec2 family competence protein [Lachnospiraceae bacterium]|nr:ComEC/Rec2 family competence protein [Lachnospiraceae bacterium]